ncbi:hypothetical protein [Azospirillum brasilense]|uniref:Transmembrane protein n=1 Tax=Azospirillum brasilense TaxID=192 RepID=A0A235HEP3_AZOBR|nr:hypothetical protein [Azospirillum brasilense]OYD84248.1 hypothetical protein CHT98_11190 [Azospirillum brasilense]
MARRLGALLRRFVLRPLLSAAALLYFLIDAVALEALRPLAAWIGRQRFAERLAARIRRLGRYPTLALFVIPLVVLEPLKPVGLYLMGTGHPVQGALLLGAVELVKVTLVERLFHIGKDKLLTIPAFAWCYVRVVRWLAWLTALPPWQAAKRAVGRMRAAIRPALALIRGWARSLRSHLRTVLKKG